MPAKPRWLLAIPDAIHQLEALDEDLLTRRDIERLFGVSKVRAVQLSSSVVRGYSNLGARSFVLHPRFFVL